MSTVKADNFTWKTGEQTAQSGSSVTGPQIVYGVAKSWISHNGSTSTIKASFNTSSVTKNATGDYTINFTNAIYDANFSAPGTQGGGGNYFLLRSYDDGTARTSSLVRMTTANLSPTSVDTPALNIAIFR